jgi:CoA:oxalate CoA-transferase
MAIVDCCLSLLSVHFQSYFISGKVPKPSGSHHPIGGISGAFKTRNGLLILGPCWLGIGKVIKREDLYTDPRFDTTSKRAANNLELCNIIEQELMKQDTEYWLEIMHKEDIPVSKLNTIDSVLDDPQVKYNQAIIELEHPAYGKMRAVECPLHFEGAGQSQHSPPPTLGQDSEEVLRGILHYSDEQIKAIRDEEKLATEQVQKRIKSQF